jgi:putative glutamine amidotransferase
MFHSLPERQEFLLQLLLQLIQVSPRYGPVIVHKYLSVEPNKIIASLDNTHETGSGYGNGSSRRACDLHPDQPRIAKVPKKIAVTYEDAQKVKPYNEALRMVGLEPVPIKAEDSASLAGVDGLLLTGGRDVDPKLYGQEPDSETQKPDPARDQMEMRLLREALDRDLPVLAICRGLQLFNVCHGGTLIQHLPGDPHRTKKRPLDPSKPLHVISVAADTRLAAILGEGRHAVNSRHHQAVDRLGSDIQVSAKAVQDEIIEGLERPDKAFAVAVQWHPEDQVRTDETQLKLFRAFAKAVDG